MQRARDEDSGAQKAVIMSTAKSARETKAAMRRFRRAVAIRREIAAFRASIAERQDELRALDQYHFRDPISKHSHLIAWRGGSMEFATNELPRYYGPPWWVVYVNWADDRSGGWFVWHDYCGPPQVFLTRKGAESRAKSFREQYRESARLVRVCKLEPVYPERR